MKKILLCLILICGLLLTGCSSHTTGTEINNKANRTAILLLPNGNIITGTCNDFTRWSQGWISITVDNIQYRLHEWRAAIIEE